MANDGTIRAPREADAAQLVSLPALVREEKGMLVTLERDETGMIVAECPAILGCVSQGQTEDEALANVREAIAACLEARADAGMPLTLAVRQVEALV